MQGDGGIDVYVGKYTDKKGIDVYQAKWFIGGIANSQKGQVRESYETVRDSTDFTAKSWTLCLPVDMSADETKWFETWTGKQSSIDIRKPWDGTKLMGLLLTPKNREIKEAFFKEDYLRQIRETHATVERLAREVDERLPKPVHVSLEARLHAIHIEKAHPFHDHYVVEVVFVFYVHNTGKQAVQSFHVVTDIVCPDAKQIVRKEEFPALSEHRNHAFDQGILPTLHKPAKVYIGVVVQRHLPVIRQLTGILPEIKMTCRVLGDDYIGDNTPVDIVSKLDWGRLQDEAARLG